MNLEKIEKAYKVKTIIYRILQLSGFVFIFRSCLDLKIPEPLTQSVLFPLCLILIIQLSFELFVKKEVNKYFGTFLYRFKKLIEHEDPILKAEKRRLYNEQLEEYKLRKSKENNLK